MLLEQRPKKAAKGGPREPKMSPRRSPRGPRSSPRGPRSSTGGHRSGPRGTQLRLPSGFRCLMGSTWRQEPSGGLQKAIWTPREAIFHPLEGRFSYMCNAPDSISKLVLWAKPMQAYSQHRSTFRVTSTCGLVYTATDSRLRSTNLCMHTSTVLRLGST